MPPAPPPPPPPSLIEVYPGAFPRDFCEHVVRLFEADPRRSPSRTYGGVNPQQRTGTLLMPQPGDVGWSEAIPTIMKGTMAHIERYAAKHESINFILRNEEVFLSLPLIERIDPGQGFNWHIDNSTAASANRVLSGIIYLRDVNGGGETEFPLQGTRIVPRAGALVLFPPFWSHPHRGAPPTRDTKYNITNFVLLGGVQATGGPEAR